MLDSPSGGLLDEEVHSCRSGRCGLGRHRLLGLAGTSSATTTPCGSGPGSNSATPVPYGTDLRPGPGISGTTGVKGDRGYIEAGGSAAPSPHGGIDGSTKGKEFYGSLTNNGVCVGFGSASQKVPPS